MRTTRRSLPTIGIAAGLLLAACNGGTGGVASTAAPGTTAATGGVTSTAPAGDATQAPVGGAATQAPAGGAAIDVCALLTEEDIKAVTGLDLKAPGKPSLPFGVFPNSCEWDLVSDAINPPMIALGVLGSDGPTEYDRYVNPFGKPYGYEPIEGLGDKAADVNGGAVLVLVGEKLFELQYLAFKDTDTELATGLAKKVVAKLG